ncbi:MAG TPA: cbb3-type cytochrome c oxidase subunit I [Candidatus Saccharimonadales bacterium]|nr:cbb3-type cytochrome c oxidase subunit I [Candidatus Saccharimonadales bacterium]
MKELLLGRLTWSDLPHEWFTLGGTGALCTMAVVTVVALTYFKRWKWLWREWLTTTDPKRIGVMYMIVAGLMLFRGALDALMIWLQQSISVGANHGYLTGAHFQQIFTAHGDIMVFFAATGFLVGLMNLVVPLQIGARDLASPLLNTTGFWLYVAGAILMNMFFVFGGEFAAAGWLSVTPLSELQYSPGVGVDYWIWSLQISGLGSLMAGINFLATIIKMRAPGMKLMHMPPFTWATLCSSVLIIMVFPILTITIFMLAMDRYLGMHFFTTTGGGNPMMYINLIWMWGHPEVYILIIPAYGVYSEIVATFSRKKLASYTSNIIGLILVTIIAQLVWLHHFFTMGAGADVNAVFGISTEFIVIPTAVLFFSWIMTMFRGHVRLKTPMYWFLAFVSIFTFGGFAGMVLATPAADFQLHNSLFLVAHFHTMIIGGALFGIFAAITYWFPKFAGFTLNETLGKYAVALWLTGFILAFVPLYILGFMGATRRLDHYTDPSWQPLFMVAVLGFLVICAGALTQVVQIAVSIAQRRQHRDTTGDPWNARTLEWSTASPVPFYNFATLPEVHGRDAFWEMKRVKTSAPKHYEDIELPRNTAMGIYLAAGTFVLGFAMVWHMFLIAGLAAIAIVAFIIIRTFDEDTEYVLPASKIRELETARRQA